MEVQLGREGHVTASAWEGGGDARVIQAARTRLSYPSPTGSALPLGSLPLIQVRKLQQHLIKPSILFRAFPDDIWVVMRKMKVTMKDCSVSIRVARMREVGNAEGQWARGETGTSANQQQGCKLINYFRIRLATLNAIMYPKGPRNLIWWYECQNSQAGSCEWGMGLETT